ncbi:thioesterase II family protein [Streptomyces sp. HU2014]|uniref:thioesterase II family protein n=1 Tax=Streptomyces TaxID=1883 RepID=UPI000B4321C7|nr:MULTISPECIES: thioesterase II family protein [Streptomyces]UQI47387.1 thioesterase II family protein [Streptomyces sp. HU2014]
MSATPVDSGTWVRRFHPSPDAGARLVCFPHAGGSASYYFPVSAAMSPSIEVLALQYPGRQDRRTDPLIESLPELADQIFTALRPFADRPLTLFGHSMGATLAFEVATRFEQVGAPVSGLFVSGRRAPSTHRTETVHLRSDDGIVSELHQLNGTDSGLLGDEELLRMVLPAIRGDYKAIETYRYEPGTPLTCPVHAMVGDADPKATLDEVRAWRDHTTGPFEFEALPGGHFYLNQYQKEIVNRISDHIACAAQPESFPSTRTGR